MNLTITPIHVLDLPVTLHSPINITDHYLLLRRFLVGIVVLLHL
jgi:hypothetical protein